MYDAMKSGNLVAVVYFFTFIILAQLVMMNLFIMIIVENFDTLNSKEDNGELEFDTIFKAVWELFDPEGTGKMLMVDLEEFLNGFQIIMVYGATQPILSYLEYCKSWNCTFGRCRILIIAMKLIKK